MSRLLQVKVKLHARASALSRADDGTWVAELKSPPVDGRANEELIALVARHFGCRKADVSLVSGATSRSKRLRVDADGP